MNFLEKPAVFHCVPFKVGENQLASLALTTFVDEICDLQGHWFSKMISNIKQLIQKYDRFLGNSFKKIMIIFGTQKV